MTSDLVGFRFQISSIEETEMNNDEKLFFYLAIEKFGFHASGIEVSKATYVTAAGEQLTQSIWLTGYLVESETILPMPVGSVGWSSIGATFRRSASATRCTAMLACGILARRSQCGSTVSTPIFLPR